MQHILNIPKNICKNKEQCIFCYDLWLKPYANNKINQYIARERLGFIITDDHTYEEIKKKYRDLRNKFLIKYPDFEPYKGYYRDIKYKELIDIMEAWHYFEILIDSVKNTNI